MSTDLSHLLTGLLATAADHDEPAVALAAVLDQVRAALAGMPSAAVAVVPPRRDAPRAVGELIGASGAEVARVIDALPLGVYVVDRDYLVRLWNRKREVGTDGVAREDAIGRSIFEVLPRQNAAVMRAELDAVFATGQLQQLQIESHASGERRTYRLTKIAMREEGAAGPVTHVITVGEDVTEWRAALERTAQAEKLAAVGQLAAGVMHEINNPLATIAACAETMTLTLADLPRDLRAPAGFAEYLRIIDHEVHRCRRITDGLLEFSRAKSTDLVPVALNTVVEQTLFLLKHHARFRRVPVRLELEEGGGPPVLGAPDQLTQVAMALLLNAADAVRTVVEAEDSDPAGVTVRTRRTAGDAVLEIADDGPGIPAEVLPKIFEPFFTTKPPGEGTGLGLAICYGIVREHGGRLEVESPPGAGATFRVVLPEAR
jgi:two-component system NtrC family sensor kinase